MRTLVDPPTAEAVSDPAGPDAHDPASPRIRNASVVLVLLTGLVVSAVLSVGFGAERLSVDTVTTVLGANLFGGEVEPTDQAIVWDLRVPRMLLAIAVGAGLAIAGAVTQTVVRNPLADPYLLGISSGASVGATAVITLGILSGSGTWGLSLGALVGALGAAVLLFVVAMAQGGLTPLRLILTGTVMAAAFGALASFLVFRSPNPNAAESVLFWLLGSLAGATWDQLALPLVTVALVGGALVAMSGWLDALASGPDTAASLGVPVQALRNVLYVLLALLVGVLVAVAGAISFVGLVLPHIARLLVGARHRIALPVAALAGAVFLVWVDVAARLLTRPEEIPLSVVTGVIGAPVFLILLGRRRYSFGQSM